MINKLDLIIIFFILNFLSISYCFKSELVHLVKSEYLLVNEDGIFHFKNNFDNEIEKIDSINEEQNTSDTKKNIKNIHKVKCFEDNTYVFINNFLYIYNSEGNFIKKIRISEKNIENKYVVLSFDSSLKEINTFNYLISYIDERGYFVTNFYKYNIFSEEKALYLKNELNLKKNGNKEVNIKENDFSCQLISNSIYCFFLDSNSNEMIVKKLNIDFSQKKINFSNLIKPKKNLIFATKILKSFISQDKSKILLFYSSKDGITDKARNNCAIYNMMHNNFEFIPEVDEFFYNKNDKTEDDINNELNMDYFSSNNKYVLYKLNEKREILILELDGFFKVESKKKYILDNKLDKSSFNLIKFYLINNNRNYQIVLLNKNNNIENNTTGLNILFSNLVQSHKNFNLRNLQDNNGQGGESGGEGGESGGQGGESGGQGGESGGQGSESGGQGSESGGQGGESGGQGGESGGEGGESGGQGGESGGQGGEGGQGANNAHQGERYGEIGGGSFDFDNKDITISREEVKENRDELMSYVEPGESYELKGEDYSIRIAPMGQGGEQGSTSIDFMDCENKLRAYYNLSNDSVLSVFQTEVTSSNNKSLTNKVQYVVYDENNTQLNLSVCENEQIKISYAIKDDSNFNMTRYSYFEEKGIDILDSTDPFFNDICYTYSDGTSDVILSDRINDIYQNYSLCDSGCEYQGLNSSMGTISCSCNVTDTDSDDDDDETANLKSIILSLFSDSTFGVVQCYKRVFQDDKTSNIGFWVFLVIIIAHIPLYVQFFMKGNSNIKNYIDQEMEKYHYLVNQGGDNNDNNSEEKKISNPPKNLKEKPKSNENKNIISRNADGDLYKKSENLNLVKNTAETEGNEDNNENKDIKLNQINQILKKENNDNIQNDKLKIVIDQNNTNDSTSKREVNQNQLITVYKTEETLGEKDEQKEKVQKEKTEKNSSKSAYFLIQIDANNSPDNDKPVESNYILNNYEYDTAIKYESRTFWRILYIVLISKDNILNTFILKSPLESKPLQICLLIFSYTCDLALNTLFYFSDNISDKYHYTGKYLFWYTLFNNILISVISTILSLILGGILNLMAESKDNMEEEFKEEEKKLRKDPNYKVSDERKKEIFQKIKKELKKLKIKMTFFVVIDLVILLFFFYFVTAFCEIYRNTQTSWISDAVVSIIISFPIELAIALGITIAYFLAVKYKWKIIYKIVMFLI